MKIEDTEVLGRQRAKPSKIKTRYSWPTCKNCSYLYALLQQYTILRARSERLKEWWKIRVVMTTEISWQVNEKVSPDMTGEADWVNLGVDSNDGEMHI